MDITLKMIKRNVKLFFKDKAMFFTSLITPIILFVLYLTFLGNVYKDSFALYIPSGTELPERLLDGLVAGQLTSSILAVSCVTVAFCSNFLMVQDKATGAWRDLTITPARHTVFALGYYVASLVATLIVCLTATLVCFAYIAFSGWYMSVLDTVLILLDVILTVLFGTALSSVVNFFLSSQGQISAVGSMISSGYGFLCGAYMPISSFNVWLQRAISFLPGTYATALFRTHALRGAITELEAHGVSSEAIEQLKDSVDCNVYFFDARVSEGAMYLILCASIALLIGIYVLMNKKDRKIK